MRLIKYLIYALPVTLIFLISCGRGTSENKRAFYYWKTTFHLTATERQSLTSLEIQKLYIRLFDVDWAAELNDIIPVGEIRFAEKPPANIEVVPTIFITNRAMQNLPLQSIETGAQKIMSQIEGICSKNSIGYTEVQLDCDWSDGTRIKYFALLENIKKHLHAQHKQISATIRLHQIKYAKRTGVPPVDRGMLMFYNMGKLEATTQRNSIYNKEDANLYINYVQGYKLPLDVALPVFDLLIQTRGKRIVDLIPKSLAYDILRENRIRKTKEDTYRAENTFFLHGVYFMEGDVIRIEHLSASELLEASESAAEHINKHPLTITLFDLDSLNLRNYDEKDIQQSFHYFN